MKKFVTPILYVLLIYALLFFYFDKVILSLIYAFVQMLILPGNLLWILIRNSKNGKNHYEKLGCYFAVTQISLVVTDFIMMLNTHPFVVSGLGLFILINLIPALFVLHSLARNPQPDKDSTVE